MSTIFLGLGVRTGQRLSSVFHPPRRNSLRNEAKRHGLSAFSALILVTGAFAFTPQIARAAKPAITSATTATGQVGVAFTYQITASNTPTSYCPNYQIMDIG
jgi:hypothetical protein